MNFTKLKSEKTTLQKMSQPALLHWFIWLRDARKVRYASIRFGWSSYQGRMGDVLALEGDEGRGSLRKAWGSRQTDVDPEIPEQDGNEYIVTVRLT